MTIKRIRSIIAATALVTAAPSIAQTDTLRALAEEALRTNPDIAAQASATRALEARVSGARAGFLPSISGSGLVERRRINVIGANAGDAQFTARQADVEARLTLFDGFQTRNTVRVRKAELAAGRAGERSTQADTLLTLLTACADLGRDQQILRYAQQQHDAIETELRGTQRRLQFGEATRTDAEQAKARLAASAAGLLSAKGQVAESEIALAAVLGRRIAVLPPVAPLSGVPLSSDEARAAAMRANPIVDAARQSAEAARQAVRVAKGALFPVIEGVGGYEYLAGGVANIFTGALPNDRSAVFGGIQARIPIFQGGREYAEIARTRAVASQRRFQLDSAERESARAADAAWQRLAVATATIVEARAGVTANEAAVAGVKREALEGSRTVIEVLDAQNELLAAQVSLERAVRNDYVARAELLQAMGRLTPESIVEPAQ